VAELGQLPERSWDWQSCDACEEVMLLAEEGAGDDTLLAVASRYTFENLVLNATHEIGEWFRFDARRVFPSHGGPRLIAGTPWQIVGDGVQGNGAVTVRVQFAVSTTTDGSRREGAVSGVAERAAEQAACWRFSYLPGTSITFSAQGPILIDEREGTGDWLVSAETVWSEATRQRLDGPIDTFVSAVQRDVHRMLIRAETERVCRAFFVDGRRQWHLCDDEPPGVSDSIVQRERDGDVIAVLVSYDSDDLELKVAVTS
jgi:hypothetical protein